MDRLRCYGGRSCRPAAHLPKLPHHCPSVTQMALQYVHSNSLAAAVFPLYFGIGDPENDDRDRASPARSSAPHEDLPYRVELGDAARQAVEIFLAVTANSSIGYAAYFAAT